MRSSNIQTKKEKIIMLLPTLIMIYYDVIYQKETKRHYDVIIVSKGVIQSVRHQAQTVDTSKTHLLLNACAHEAKVAVKPS